MRSPLYEAADNDLEIYQGFFKNGGVNGNQVGGALIYRSVSRDGVVGAWVSEPLNFFSDVGGSQFWRAILPSTEISPTDVIEYYLRVDFEGPQPETTYLYGNDLIGDFSVTLDEAEAQGAPYSLRNRPGWIFHAGDVTVTGAGLTLGVKTGYVGPTNDPVSLWSNQGAVYFTNDGSSPVGSLGVASGTTSVVPLVFDGTQQDDSGNGNAAMFRASLDGVLDGLPLGGEIRYRIGLWNTDTNEEKFADHSAGVDNSEFVYTNGQLGDPVLTINGLNGNYTTSKLFVDEIAGDSIPLEINFAPGEPNITEAEIYTNLNRRDRAGIDANNDGYPDGISALDGNDLVAGDDTHYYRAYPMTEVGPGQYSLTLNGEKTGAYRLTARWKVAGDDDWRWYTNIAANRRDHAVTISPIDARDIVLYEINVLNIEATGDTFETRSTIEDMHNAAGALHNGNNRWDLDYLTGLGANWLWFQPIHPAARDGREPFGGWQNVGNPPYEPGSPYAVKNFFEISPIMTKDFVGSPFDNEDLANPVNRETAMLAWQDFAAAADAKGVGLMLDAPFNHTGFDVELAEIGVELFQPDGQTWLPSDEIRNREARFFSAEGNYGARASSAANIAAAPDREDFGKWRDVKDVFFGRYDALVENAQEPQLSSYTNEGDWFDSTDPSWTATDFFQNGEPRNVTKLVWVYFAKYAPYWLEKTRPEGQNINSENVPGLTLEQRYEWDARGIDGLRCDFGQGLPPQAWEYMINYVRSYKWNFVMMSESLDGGAVTYRSNRHFDILNENIVFPLKAASNKFDYRNIFEDRRNAYGQGLVLTNSVSHDEENYADPWEALIRFATVSTLDGVPMIFPGQELGISTTFGYDHYELNFGKQIPHFKRFNSMHPIWLDSDFGNLQLYPVYSAIGQARLESPALRSSERWFLDGDGNNPVIHAVAKYEAAGLSPAVSDVVIALTNLDRNNQQSDNFVIPSPLKNLLGLADNRMYNVKNIAAYTGFDETRRDEWLWGSGLTGAELESSGFFAQLNPVPTTAAGWETAPYEAQYLKLYDITAPTGVIEGIDLPYPQAYGIGDSVRFSWQPLGADAMGVEPAYRVNWFIGGQPAGSALVSDSYYTVIANIGDEVAIRVQAVNPDFPDNGGPLSDLSDTVILLAPEGDEDGDGQTNLEESIAGSDPFLASSRFAVTGLEVEENQVVLTTPSTEGRFYYLQASNTLQESDWVTLPASPQEADDLIRFDYVMEEGSDFRFFRIMVTESELSHGTTSG